VHALSLPEISVTIIPCQIDCQSEREWLEGSPQTLIEDRYLSYFRRQCMYYEVLGGTSGISHMLVISISLVGKVVICR